MELVEATHLLKQQWNEIKESKAIKGTRLEGMPRYAREEQVLPLCWIGPPFRKIKVNCDGAWLKETGQGG